jgi:ketol-acid reductoisomerase
MAPQVLRSFNSSVFEVEEVDLGTTREMIVRGSHTKFPLFPQAFRGVKQVGVIGWGSQGPAQAQNLRESLAGTGIKVVVGLQEGSKSIPAAQAAGFTHENGTLGEMFRVISESDLVILLISDAAQVQLYPKIFGAMKPGATLGLSHGFLVGYLESIKERLPSNISVIGVCPKGMGPSVRKLYQQGSGINCSFAVEQSCNSGASFDLALGWAIAIGAPTVFYTTLGDEWRSDLFGERSDLLAGVWGLVEAVYRYLRETSMPAPMAFRDSVENLTGVIAPIISEHGLLGLYNQIPADDKHEFMQAYSTGYWPFYSLALEIYQEVASGREIGSVISAGERLKTFPMVEIGNTDMWKVGRGVQQARLAIKSTDVPDPMTAGLYCAMIVAQVDVLTKMGHCLSEICNESVIEATDSLLPFMHARGVAYMVDNCSITARIGTRKWGPRWEHVVWNEVLPFVGYNKTPIDQVLVDKFTSHPIHKALEVCMSLRPSIRIAVD